MGARHTIVSRLLADDNIRLVHTRDGFGYTPLMYAAMRCSEGGRSTACVVHTLIRKGYDGASVDETDALGYTPLLMACRCRNWAAARVLLEQGQAEFRLRDSEFRHTAIEWVMCSAKVDDGDTGCGLGGPVRTPLVVAKDRRRKRLVHESAVIAE